MNSLKTFVGKTGLAGLEAGRSNSAALPRDGLAAGVLEGASPVWRKRSKRFFIPCEQIHFNPSRALLDLSLQRNGINTGFDSLRLRKLRLLGFFRAFLHIDAAFKMSPIGNGNSWRFDISND